MFSHKEDGMGEPPGGVTFPHTDMSVGRCFDLFKPTAVGPTRQVPARRLGAAANC